MEHLVICNDLLSDTDKIDAVTKLQISTFYHHEANPTVDT